MSPTSVVPPQRNIAVPIGVLAVGAVILLVAFLAVSTWLWWHWLGLAFVVLTAAVLWLSAGRHRFEVLAGLWVAMVVTACVAVAVTSDDGWGTLPYSLIFVVPFGTFLFAVLVGPSLLAEARRRDAELG